MLDLFFCLDKVCSLLIIHSSVSALATTPMFLCFIVLVCWRFRNLFLVKLRFLWTRCLGLDTATQNMSRSSDMNSRSGPPLLARIELTTACRPLQRESTAHVTAAPSEHLAHSLTVIHFVLSGLASNARQPASCRSSRAPHTRPAV